jgi:hypothetical protein
MGTLFFCAHALMLYDVNSLHTLNVKVQQEVFCGNKYYCGGCNRRLKDHFLRMDIILFCCQILRGKKKRNSGLQPAVFLREVMALALD